MRIAYLHGLESTIDKTKPKIKFLKENFTDAFTPSIDYTKENNFEHLYSSIKAMNPDLIVGSSMGGYFGYLIGSKLGIETILFNPAVVGRSYDPIVDDTKLKSTMHNVFLGKTDDVIIGKHVKTYFKEKGTGVFNYESYEGSHRVPAETFINAINTTIGIKK
jgi:predicted esterase YcpF (UPF0227 family)